ncbi:MAG: spondin domain-containing protein [Acidimicrobiales bacterium]
MHTRVRFALALLVAALLATVVVPSASAQQDQPRRHTYRITIENVTENQILTPPVYAVHNQRADVFDLGRRANAGVREIAENGNLDPLVEALADTRGVRSSGVGAGDNGPLMPGTDATFRVRAPRGARLLSTVQMVVCTNDGFTGLDSLRLPRGVDRSVTAYLYAFDAGTETNTDDVADFVPPCSGGETGTGMSNPALAERGVIAPHPGLTGAAAEMWGFDADAPVAKITVTRIR